MQRGATSGLSPLIRWLSGLNAQILIAAAAGILLGFLLNPVADESALKTEVLYWTGLAGRFFIDLLKMILIPLIFTSIVTGIANLQAHQQAGKVWRYALGFFALSMVCAMLLSLIVTGWLKPGSDLQLAMFQQSMDEIQARQMTGGEFLAQFLHSLFMNPFGALADGKILPVVVFAVFLGVALVKAGPSAAGHTDQAGEGRGKQSGGYVLAVLQEFLDLLMLIIGWVMKLAPLGVFALLTKLMATQDMALLGTMGEFIVLVFAITLIHGVLVLPGLMYLFTRKSPLWLLRGARPAMVTAFATSSSAATLPLSINCAEQSLSVKKDVAGFVLPVGATMNMDGTALYEASAALFIAYLCGMDLSVGQQIIVMLTAMVASMGAPGIPSAGMVTMVMVLQSVGLPAEAIAILLPIDRILDTVRTAVNVEGDIVTSVVVDNALGSGQ
ncbi:MAG: dicarboxylate/amino acid:cation symporter [Oceanospirillaceae bacterium]|nr:dicarboxylate/amino acid:cation symporter [Oceanospirillaceae bacterium]MBT13092.1 dicarboxylate/amino acid:cation symporter [Oceanospirillaceae bacterium]|tara:strand:+ start:17567 stop:18892 length:1326 start_codon:yes stop_codon:yes gene_type:complete